MDLDELEREIRMHRRGRRRESLVIAGCVLLLALGVLGAVILFWR